MTEPTQTPAGVISPDALDLQRRLLREVVRRAETFHVTGEVLTDPDQNTAQSQSDAGRETRANATTLLGSSLQAAFASRYFHRPVAEELAPEELAACIEHGDDPWAAGLDGAGPLDTIPIGDLLAACGFIRSFAAGEDLDVLLAPRANGLPLSSGPG